MGKHKRKTKKTRDKNEKSILEKEISEMDFFARTDTMRMIASKKFMDVIQEIFVNSEQNEIANYLGRFLNYHSNFSHDIHYGDPYTMGHSDISMNEYNWVNLSQNRFGRLMRERGIEEYNYYNSYTQHRNQFGYYQHSYRSYRPKPRPKNTPFEYADFFKWNNTPDKYYNKLKNKPVLVLDNGYRIIDFQRFNFIGVSDCGDYITFLPFDKRNEAKWRYGDIEFFKDHKRSKMKIGRFINQFLKNLDKGFDGKLSGRYGRNKMDNVLNGILGFESQDKKIDWNECMVSPKKIEDFVNLYKCFYGLKFGKLDFAFKVLKGKDILKGYTSGNHLNLGGSLMNSCMTDKTQFLEIYTENENVSLLTLQFMDKIAGRALLWETKSGDKIMDRVYYTKDYFRKQFEVWARDNNYKTQSDLIDERFSVQLSRNKKYNSYPYLDSFFYFNRFTKRLYNKSPKDGIRSIYNKMAYRKLHSTNGSSSRYRVFD